MNETYYNVIELSTDKAYNGYEAALYGAGDLIILQDAPLAANVKIAVGNNTNSKIPLQRGGGVEIKGAKRFYLWSNAVAGGKIVIFQSRNAAMARTIQPLPDKLARIDEIDRVNRVMSLDESIYALLQQGIENALNNVFQPLIMETPNGKKAWRVCPAADCGGGGDEPIPDEEAILTITDGGADGAPVALPTPPAGTRYRYHLSNAKFHSPRGTYCPVNSNSGDLSAQGSDTNQSNSTLEFEPQGCVLTNGALMGEYGTPPIITEIDIFIPPLNPDDSAGGGDTMWWYNPDDDNAYGYYYLEPNEEGDGATLTLEPSDIDEMFATMDIAIYSEPLAQTTFVAEMWADAPYESGSCRVSLYDAETDRNMANFGNLFYLSEISFWDFVVPNVFLEKNSTKTVQVGTFGEVTFTWDNDDIIATPNISGELISEEITEIDLKIEILISTLLPPPNETL